MAIKAPENLADTVWDATPAHGPWQSYNLAPESRIVHPKAIYATEGSVENPAGLLKNDSSAILSGRDALVTLDFGVNTAGIITLKFGTKSTPGTNVSIAFAESKQFISRTSDRSTDFAVEDTVLTIAIDGNSTWTCPAAQMRGAFRYVTIFMASEGKVELCDIETYNNMMPSYGDELRNYAGYFYSSDEFLNEIWYAGAYTLQLSTIPTNTGRRSDWVHQKTGWNNDRPAAPHKYVDVLTDGARRDRTVWSGDRGISELTSFVALNATLPVKAGVDWMFEHQTDEGEFPYACKPIWHYGSDTYHLWTFIALYNAYFYDGGEDAKDWVREKWASIKLGLEYAAKKVDKNGLFLVTRPLDWGRNILKGHNLEANCLYYYSLKICSAWATDLMGDRALGEEWNIKAEFVKKAVNTYLWNEEAGMYTDFVGADILPQDGNTLAVWYGLADDPTKIQQISAHLPRNWNAFGAVAPESPGMISPFCSSMELITHFTAKQPSRAMQLLRTMWGYMWNAPYSVRSSLIEGYYHDGRCHYPFTKYDPAYISHAHPWASGPTIVLTFFLVGLRVLDAEHGRWAFEPQLEMNEEEDGKRHGDKVGFAMAGFTSNARGFFSAGWKVGEDSIEMAIKAPEGTVGTIAVPKLGKEIRNIDLDGEEVTITSLRADKDHVYMESVSGGKHIVLATYV